MECALPSTPVLGSPASAGLPVARCRAAAHWGVYFLYFACAPLARLGPRRRALARRAWVRSLLRTCYAFPVTVRALYHHCFSLSSALETFFRAHPRASRSLIRPEFAVFCPRKGIFCPLNPVFCPQSGVFSLQTPVFPLSRPLPPPRKFCHTFVLILLRRAFRAGAGQNISPGC